MKKLDYNHLTTGALTVDASHLIGVVNDLIDLVNSQQEAIEKLESKVWTAGFIEKYRPALENLAEADDTHRTVTLRIPKDMKLLDALWLAGKKAGMDTFWDMLDTDLQAAIDKITKEKK